MAQNKKASKTQFKTILIACGGTGGHLFPGVAVAHELKKQGHNAILLLSEKAIDAKAASKYAEFKSLTLPVMAKPKTLSLAMVVFLWKLLISIIGALKIIKKYDIDGVLAMGGFSSLAPVIAGKLKGRGTWVHDSNAIPGKANLLNAKFCQHIFLGFEEAGKYFKLKQGQKISVVGTPIRQELLANKDQQQARVDLGLDADKLTILVTGGSQGAASLNTKVLEAAAQLEKLGQEIQWIHLAGMNYSQSVAQQVEVLGINSNTYKIIDFCEDMLSVYAASDLVISRSGASAMNELSALAKPCLLVPYPYAADDHQAKNAQIFASKKAAVMCLEADLSSKTIQAWIEERQTMPLLIEQEKLSLQQLFISEAEKTMVNYILA